jgi:hypothetical protein
MEKLPKKIVNIKYKRMSDYKTIPATGAVGGATPQGEVMCNFFVEYKETPDLLKLEINPADGSSKEIEKVEKDTFVREIEIGILMRADVAKLIGEWLIEQAEVVLQIGPKLNS